MNHPTQSKINWTQLAVATIGFVVAMDYLPQDVKEPLVDMTLILGPALTIVFRTWFTGGQK